LSFSDNRRSARNPAAARRARPQVALLVETSKTYGRGLLHGVARYVRTHEPWSLFIDERALDEPLPWWLRRWQGDGILLRSSNEATTEAVKRLGVPVVYLGESEGTGLPMLHSSDHAIVHAAIEHLHERGFRRFAYIGLRGKPWSDQRRDLYRDRLRDLECPCDVFQFTPRAGQYSSWPSQEAQLTDWLRGLVKPVAVLVCYDVMGVRVLEACREAGIAVPEQAAVLSVDNDALLCELADPPLTSVAHDLVRIGYQAAELLDRLMAGEMLTGEATIQLAPAGVVARQSTDVLAIDDALVADAARFIRRHACQGIKVYDVLHATGLTRPALNRRFHRCLGRSAKQEILRVQINRCRQLLAETDYTLERIAELTGFRHPEYMSVAFKRVTGQTPGAYRHQQHARHAARAEPATDRAGAHIGSY